jgi:hypothetical protein
MLKFSRVNNGYAVEGIKSPNDGYLEYNGKFYSLTGDGNPYYTISSSFPVEASGLHLCKGNAGSASDDDGVNLPIAEISDRNYVAPEIYYYDRPLFKFYVIVGIPSLGKVLDKLGLKYSHVYQHYIIPTDTINLSQFSDYFPQYDGVVIDVSISQPPDCYMKMFSIRKNDVPISQKVNIKPTRSHYNSSLNKVHYKLGSFDADESEEDLPLSHHKMITAYRKVLGTDGVLEETLDDINRKIEELERGSSAAATASDDADEENIETINKRIRALEGLPDMLSFEYSGASASAATSVEDISNVKLGLTPLLNDWEGYLELTMCSDITEFDKHLEGLIYRLTPLIASPGEVENLLHAYLNYGKTSRDLRRLVDVLIVKMRSIGCL